MKKLTTKEIRQIWLDFWKEKGHQVIPSKSLIPVNDPSLLWINSGVATLKDYFSGKKIPQNPRLTNSQKSIRTNDIENVGVTARHHTFFEMLGNFSIGDYFKEDALKWAWELLTEVYNLDASKLYITYFEDDKETYDFWVKLGVNKTHLIKGNREMNFWDVGQGPCGPDTEIFYDRGEEFDTNKKGIVLLEKDIENDRYVEIWNIVFSQYNNDGNGNYNDLAQKNIDTGAGLERLASIFQDTPTNFETDAFMPLILAVEKLTDVKYSVENYFVNDHKVKQQNKHFRIIADHIRAVAVAIEDGAKPSNTQRGYIIRRLIRRAYRSGIQLGIKDEAFLYKLISTVQTILDIYSLDVSSISEIVKKEELSFAKTIEQGEALLQKELIKTKDELDFSIAFKLFETYGFPIELTQEILAEKNIKLDISQFNKFQTEHAKNSRGEVVSGMETQIKVIQQIKRHESKFVGYEVTSIKTNVLFSENEGDLFYTLLSSTPFYPTGGGQQADRGNINGVDVLNVFKDKYDNVWHITSERLSGNVEATVDSGERRLRSANHSATHLLGFALRKVFGNAVVQLGSDNNNIRLRFDFPLSKRPTAKELTEVENIVNDLIKDNIQREYIETTFSKGKDLGAITLEGEDYGNDVRIVKFEDVIEFCGGTHVSSTKDIEAFKITKFESKGSGVFRIEAITSNKDIDKFESSQINNILEQIKIATDKIKIHNKDFSYKHGNTLDELKADLENLRKILKQESKKNSSINFDTNVKFKEYEGMKAYINLNLQKHQLKQVAITLREAHVDALIIIGATENGRTTMAVASKNFDSKEIFDNLAEKYSGKGGGNSEFAMGSMMKVNL